MPVENIEIAGGVLAVEVSGSGPLIICSPGMGDTRDAYAPLTSQLTASGYTVAAMDIRGHGDSSIGFDKYGDEATSEDFLTIIQHLGKGTAVLAGDSFAAGAATIAAGKRPDLVAGIILLGPFLRNGMGGGAISTYVTPALFYRPYGPWVWETYAKTLWPGLGDKVAARAAESRAHLTRPGRWAAFQNTVAGCDHRVVEPWIKKVQCPVLVVMGDKDPDWGQPLKEAEWIASNFQDVENVAVNGAGHAPMLESPDFVGKKVVAFVERVKAKGNFK